MTFDIIPFEEKVKTAINFKETMASNKDIFDLIPYGEKNKIDFRNFKSSSIDKEEYKSFFDMSFIDVIIPILI